MNSKHEKLSSYIGGAAAIVIFQIVAPSLFSANNGHGLDFFQVLCAVIAGGLGGVFGRLIYRAQLNKSNK